MGVQTSNITTGSGDLSIEPNGGQTLIKSVNANNPGVTPVASASDGTVKKLVVTDLATKSTLDDNDWVLVHDSATGNTVRVPGSEFGGIDLAQPPFSDPLPETNGNWISAATALAVRAGGNGTTADLKNSVEFAVNNQTFNQSQKNVNPADKVYVRWMASKIAAANHGQTISGELYSTDGNFSQIWNLTISKQPGSWNIPPKVNQPVSTEITSDIVVPRGMNAASPVTIGGGTLTNIKFSINGGGYGTSGNIEDGQTLQIRGTTGAANATTYTADISIGGSTQTWNVTTVDAAAPPPLLTPRVTVPVDGGNVVAGSTVTYGSSIAAGLNPGGDTLELAEWKIGYGGGVAPGNISIVDAMYPSLTGSAPNVYAVIPAAALNQTIYSTVRYKWTNAGYTPWQHETYGNYHLSYGTAGTPPPPPPTGGPPTGPPPPSFGNCSSCGPDSSNKSSDWQQISTSTTNVTSPVPITPGSPVSITYTGSYSGRDPATGAAKQPVGGKHVSEDGHRTFNQSNTRCGPIWPTKTCDDKRGNNNPFRLMGHYAYSPPNSACRTISHGDAQYAFVACTTRATTVGGVTGDTAGTAAPGDVLKFVNLEIDGRPAWTTEYHYSIISYKYVPDDGSQGACGGTEVTLNKEFELGLKAFKWPANANEIDPSALETSKVTEIKIGVRIVWSDVVDEVTTIYATGCP